MRKLLVLVLALAPLAAAAATPSEGLALKVRRGFFTETDVGAFMTLGGNNQYSNLQSYLQLGVGYDISDVIEVGFHFGIGSNAANCWAGFINGTQDCSMSDNFTVTFIDATAGYLLKLRERLYLPIRVSGGWTTLDPAPVKDGNGTLIGSGPNLGVGVGIEYATSMDHFSIGADVMGRFIIGPNIMSLQFFPKVKYTF